MAMSYTSYTNLSLHALTYNPKASDIIQKKQEIFRGISDHYKSVPKTVLFYGFNAMLLSSMYSNPFVTDIDDETKYYLDTKGIKYTYIANQDLQNYQKKFSWVVATEEYFTFAASELEQQKKVQDLAKLANEQIITTLRDYKNQDFKEKEFSLPLSIYNHNACKIFLEYHNYNFSDKNSWETTVYELDGAAADVYGPYTRRAMYFKQLAKFSIDAGAKNFYVHKNLMYKSLIKKNYEHVISISF
jgi:hypothetical protein